MLLDLASRQDIEALGQKLDAVLGLFSKAQALAADEFLSLEQVAAYVQFDRKTVRKWVEEGEYNAAGKRICLPAYKYSGRLRFKRADVEAFGLGVGVLVAVVGASTPEATKKTKKNRAVTSEQALRKVA